MSKLPFYLLDLLKQEAVEPEPMTYWEIEWIEGARPSKSFGWPLVGKQKYRYCRLGHDLKDPKIGRLYYKKLSHVPYYTLLCRECHRAAQARWLKKKLGEYYESNGR